MTKILIDRSVVERALEAMSYADACLKKQLTTKTKHEHAQDMLLSAGSALRQALEQDVSLINEGNKEVQQRPQNCGTGYCSCIECVMKPAQQQEPVAWMYDWTAYGQEGETVIRDWISADYDEAHSPTNGCHNIRPLYTSPPASKPWVGLTDDEIIEALNGISFNAMTGFNIAKAIEAKLKEKNT